MAYFSGEWDVITLGKNMPLDLLMYWIAYLSKKDLEHNKLDYAMARQTAVIAQSMGGAKNAKESDFLIKFQTQQEREAERMRGIDSFFNKLGKKK